MTRDDDFPPEDVSPSDMARRLSDSLSPREHALQLLRHTLLEEQLAAIKALIHRNQQADAATRIKFQELEDRPDWDGPNAELLEDLRDERFWEMTFQTSANSMAAVGMLAPFVESLFVAIFDGLKRSASLPEDHPRLSLPERDRWNPQLYAGSNENRTDLLHGIRQLADLTALEAHLPSGYEEALQALIAYRNNMFHNGFEWPEEVAGRFESRIASESWPNSWFDKAERNSAPWLFYMTPEFCAHCVEIIDGIIEGLGRYLRERAGASLR